MSVKLDRSILRVTPSRDSKGALVYLAGLIAFRLAHWVDGVEVFACTIRSGQAGAQVLRTYANSLGGSMEPIPEAVYPLGRLEYAPGANANFTASSPAFSPALGPFWITITSRYDLGLDPDGRGELGVHMDWNGFVAPGTAGCTGVVSIADGNALCHSCERTPPTQMVVDHGLGTVPAAPGPNPGEPLPANPEPVPAPLWKVYRGLDNQPSTLLDTVPIDANGRATMTAQVLAGLLGCELTTNTEAKAIRFELPALPG